MFMRPSRATCIRTHSGKQQTNTRLDTATWSKLKALESFYSDLTGLKVKNGVVIRRAIHLLRDHVDNLSTIEKNLEESVLKRCAEGRK